MKGNRHPITELGSEKLLTRLIEKGAHDRKLGNFQVVRSDSETIGGRSCERIDVIHPEKRELLDAVQVEHEFCMSRIWFDKEKLIPLEYASYTCPIEARGEPLLEEEHTNIDLQLDVGFGNDDFDAKNPDYRFP